MGGAQGCVGLDAPASVLAGATDCTGCIGRFNNVAPQQFRNDFSIDVISQPDPDSSNLLTDMITRVAASAAEPSEPAGSVLNTPGDPLAIDDTADATPRVRFHAQE